MNRVAAACSIGLAFFLGVLVGDLRHVPDAGGPLSPESAAPALAAPAAAAPAAPAAAPEAADDRGPQQDSDRIPVGDSPSLGPATALVTIVEFSDFQCSFCGDVEATLRQVRERFGDSVRIVWKNNPLPMHANATVAAEAAMEAYAQGGNEKFWRMHDALYQHQDALDRPALDRYARELGLDMARFQRAMDGHAHAASIDRDRALLTRLGGRGTPNFYVNGTPLRGAQPLDRFVAAVDSTLERARAVRPRSRAYARMVADAAGQERVEDPDAVYRVPVGASPTLGPGTALVTVVVFSDFQCPFCARAEVTLRALRARYGDEIRFVWKNEPLGIHDRARPAAQLAMEAYAQGGNERFWRAHDLLFEHPTALARADLEGYGRELGLDPARLRAALDGNAHDAAINADHALAQQLGVDGTPCFYINGRRLSGAKPEEAFVRVIDDVRRRAEEALRAAPGTTRANLYERTVADGATALRFVGGAAPAAAPAAAPPPADESRIYTVRPNPRAPSFGAANARVVIEHFSDFQCPFCARVGPVVEQIRRRYGDRVRLVWRNYPLSMHPQAMLAAEAAMEAYAQRGNAGFWPFHDLLFQRQSALERPQLEQYAAEQHLDLARFRAALDAHTHRAAIQDDMAAAGATGADLAMPTFFIGGRFVAGALPFEEFSRRIDAALAAAPR
jgi:protein-disulfide isomerase